MQVIVKPLSELTAAPHNPRTISDTALAGLKASIDKFGLVAPVVWNERTGHIVGGHQRIRALEMSGATEAPVVVVDLPESEEKALNVTLNNPGIQGEFTPDVLPLLDELEELDPIGFEELRLTNLRKVLWQPTDMPEGREYDESIAETVNSIVCPKCGYEFVQ